MALMIPRPGSDLSRESLAFRLDRLEHGHAPGATHASAPFTPSALLADDSGTEGEAFEAPSIELAQVQEAWRRSILKEVEERSIPTAMLLAEAHPALLEADVLTLEFPATAGFLRTQAEDPKNAAVLQEALYAVTGRRLALTFAVGPDRDPVTHEHEHPATEEEIVELMKSTFDAREVET